MGRAGTRLCHNGGICDHLAELEPDLWIFASRAHPQRSRAGRAVLWRKRSLGTKTDADSRAVEPLLTVVTALRQQQRDVLDYLTLACHAATLGSAPPSMVPIAAPTPLPLSPASARPVA